MSRIVCLDCLEREQEQEQGEFLRGQMLRFLDDFSPEELNNEALSRLDWGGEGTLAAIIIQIMKERLSVTPDGTPPEHQ